MKLGKRLFGDTDGIVLRRARGTRREGVSRACSFCNAEITGRPCACIAEANSFSWRAIAIPLVLRLANEIAPLSSLLEYVRSGRILKRSSIKKTESILQSRQKLSNGRFDAFVY